MLFIVGVGCHCYQRINLKTPACLTERFGKYIHECASDKKIRNIGEEMHDDFLGKDTRSLCREIALNAGLHHIMCDPNDAERCSIGYTSNVEYYSLQEDVIGPNDEQQRRWAEFDAKQWHIRELFWFNKLKPYSKDNTLFVCGAAHVDSFAALIADKGLEVQICCQTWE